MSSYDIILLIQSITLFIIVCDRCDANFLNFFSDIYWWLIEKLDAKRRAKERQIEHEKLKDPLKYYMNEEEFERKLRGE